MPALNCIRWDPVYVEGNRLNVVIEANDETDQPVNIDLKSHEEAKFTLVVAMIEQKELYAKVDYRKLYESKKAQFSHSLVATIAQKIY